MADSLLEVLYLAPSDPSRTPIAHVALGFQAALRKAEGIAVRPLLGLDCSENLHGQPHGVAWVRRMIARALDGQPAADDQVLHVDMGRLTQREFWAAQQVLRQRPRCALSLLFHDPPHLPDPVQLPRPNPRGGLVERLLGIGSFEALFHGLADHMAGHARVGLERAFLERATALLCLSRRAAELLAQHYPQHRHKIGCLRPPLLGPPAPDRLEPPQRGDNEPVRITCFGRIEPGKAYADLFGALSILNNESSLVGLVEVRLWGHLTPQARASGLLGAIERQIEARGLRWLVDIQPDFQSEALLNELLEETDILVLPYRPDGCSSTSRSLLRSAAWAVAVAASDVGCMRELIQPGVTGLLYPPGDAAALALWLRQLIDEPAKRAVLAAALRKHALATHSEGALAPTLRAVYSEIARAHQEGRAVRLPEGVRYEAGAGHD